MPRTRKGQASPQQFAYAQRLFGGQGKTKKQIALDVGYSPYVANSLSSHVEKTVGFHAAMAKLANDSNNVAMKVMHELESRGFENFSNKDLVGAVNAIANAWSKFTENKRPKKDEQPGNRLRTVVLQQIENQTLNTGNIHEAPAPQEVVEVEEAEEEMDF